MLGSLSMVHTASCGVVIKTRTLAPDSLYSNLLPCCLENLINTLELQFACLEIGEYNASLMELL